MFFLGIGAADTEEDLRLSPCDTCAFFFFVDIYFTP